MRKKPVTRFLLGLLSTAAAGATLQAGPIQWSGNGHYYDIIINPGQTWTGAAAAANASTFMGVNGHLVTITSSDENGFLASLIASLTNPGQLWAGGYQGLFELSQSSGWSWVNGEGSFTYTNWATGQPDDALGTASEQFLALGQSGLWFDGGASCATLGYIVEYAVPPAGASVPDSGSLTALAGAVLIGLAGFRGRRQPGT